MRKFIYFMFAFFVILSFSNAQADERKCLIAYEKMTKEVENAASASSAGDACRAADGVEEALNWLGTCEIECSYSKSRMDKIYQYKRDLTNTLAKYVKKCGH